MAIVFLDGFDKYGPVNNNAAGVQALLQAEWNTATSGLTIVAALSATGFAVSMTVGPGTLSKTLAGNYSRLIGGVRISVASLIQTCGIQFADVATNQCGICINQTTGTFSVRNGAYNSGTVLGTSTTSITAGSTHYLEWDITFSNTGAYQLWLDGVSILSGSSVDTTGSANNYANVFQFVTANLAVNPTIDDFYLFDTTGTINNAVLLNSPRIETAFPVSDSAVQFAVGAGILGSSAARVTTTNAPAAGSLVLRRFTPAVAGTLSSISIMPGATSAGANYRGVVYADSGGTAPGTLMSSGTQVTGVTSGTVANLPLTTPQSLSAGAQYWIGFINDTSVVLQQTDAGNLGYRAANTYASGAPGTAPAMTSGQASWLLWGNLTASGANYDQVNQQPPDGQYSYVFDATVGHEDLYNFPPITTSTVHAVAVKASLAKSDSGAKTASIRLKSGTTNSAGSVASVAPGTTYGWGATYFATDPDTGAAWTPAGLNAAQAGVRVAS